MTTTSAARADARVLDILDEYLTERLAGRPPDRDAHRRGRADRAPMTSLGACGKRALGATGKPSRDDAAELGPP